MERVPKAARLVAGVAALLVVLVAALVGSGCGGSDPDSSSAAEADLTGSAFPGIDKANTRFAKGSIDTSNVSELAEAWSVPLTAQSAYGAYAATPAIGNGVIYSQDLESNVQAIDLASGEVLWTKRYDDPSQGPNGVVVDDGTVFGATSTAAFALDQKTGKQLWATTLARNAKEGIDMAPGYHEGIVYVSTVPGNARGFYEGEGIGILWALDGKTGKKLWRFNTVPTDLWSKKSFSINSGGGLWQPPSFDEKGSIYFGTGNPAPFPGTPEFPWGSSRPGPNLYTNSVVKLDAKTGKMDWYYQQTPHDVYDWDFQNPPVLVEAGGKKLAIGSGKVGIVTALDRETGKPVWSTPVGEHNGHDDDGLYAMRGEDSKLKKEAEVLPGVLGGVIAPVASNETTLFVPVVNGSATQVEGASLGGGSEMTGELVALDIATGKVQWKQEFPAAAFGSPVAVNDLVFVSTFDGIVYALDDKGGREVWQASLPAGSNTAVMVSGDTLVVPAGIASAEGQLPAIVAFRPGG